jgi:hypothetical protein
MVVGRAGIIGGLVAVPGRVTTGGFVVGRVTGGFVGVVGRVITGGFVAVFGLMGGLAGIVGRATGFAGVVGWVTTGGLAGGVDGLEGAFGAGREEGAGLAGPRDFGVFAIITS